MVGRTASVISPFYNFLLPDMLVRYDYPRLPGTSKCFYSKITLDLLVLRISFYGVITLETSQYSVFTCVLPVNACTVLLEKTSRY